MNFNIVKKPNKKDEDDDLILDEDEIELEEEKTRKTNNDAAKKKMFRFMGIIVGVMIVLLIVLYLASLFSSRNYTFDEVETILKEASIAYFKDNPESLPKDEGSIVEIDSSNLVAAEKMKDLSEYKVDGIICSGNVHVERAGDDYLYTPYLNCGENYATTELYKKVLEEKNIVTTGYGLYSNENGYAYRGEEVNNYVELDNSLWRIVKVTDNYNVVLINDTGLNYSQPWDNRYNETRLYESGINNYNASRIKEYLEKIYSNPSKENGEDILSNKDKTRIVAFNVCTGKRTINSESKDNSEECLETVPDQKLGLLTISDYLFASLDENCKSPINKSCKNYNYLSQVDNWWLVTANKDDTSTVFKVNQSGVVVSDNASTYSVVRPVIYLNSTAMYKSGDGTKEKPYKLK